MSILSSVTRLFLKQSRMSSASVYRRTGRYFVVTQHGSGGGDPCIVAGPIEVVLVESTNTELGTAILRALSRTTHNYAYPANPQEWKQVLAPLLGAAQCKSWSAFAKTSSDLTVNQIEGTFSIHTSTRGAKRAFYPAAERTQNFDALTPEQLGRLVAAELEHASNRDDA